MTSPLNEPMSEGKARKIVFDDRPTHGYSDPEYYEAKGFLKGVESERAKHLERVEQEKLRNAELEERTAATAMKLLRAQEALQAADRMAEAHGPNSIASFRERKESLEDYRAARAKVGG